MQEKMVSPVVVVPKPGGDIRLCIDMRRADEATRRARHPLPTVDEITHSMNGSKMFNKLDLKWGYHQLELIPESRGITTFVHLQPVPVQETALRGQFHL